ncbi:glycosyltransferase [Aquimarina longa]|uniref:glycosyltransferase n=1 Tax=Aquimarina longa TaxID=1080221 RepID=UPI000780D334|nr:glycosyltransferase [Aquimarina longa]
MNKKPRLLLIFYRPPYPLVGGDKIRMHQNLRLLSTEFDVDVLFINENKKTKNIENDILKYSKNVISFSFSKINFYFSTLIGLFKNTKPLQVNYYYFEKVQKWIDLHINNYEYAFCSTIRTAEYIKDKKIFKIIDFVDAISMNYEKAFKNKKWGLWKLIYMIDKKRVLNYEISLLPKFDRKIIISNIDKEYIEKNAIAVNIEVVYNAVNIESYEEYYYEEVVDSIVFVGKMDYEPNISAVNYFANKILPEIIKFYPNIQFYIIGANPSKIVKKLGNDKNIIVTGYVDDIKKYILPSRLVVAPMVSGAGIQNKILMSMAMKKCVITTEIGAEGLINLSKTNAELVITKSDKEMVSEILELLKKPELCRLIGNNSLDYIKENFSETRIKEKLLSIFNFRENV